MSHALALSAQPRRRALVELNAAIDQAERTRNRWRLDVGDAAGRGRGAVRAEAMLHLAERRLARLRESREVLLASELDA